MGKSYSSKSSSPSHSSKISFPVTSKISNPTTKSSPTQPDDKAVQPSTINMITSSAIGSIVGNMISNTIMHKNDNHSQFNPCADQYNSFLQCLKVNDNNPNACKQVLEILNKCRETN